jgi:hypothetical protein
MAKFPYDVNTTRRIIDVYKQFQGGLKTVDTDDSLGSVFLRQAENVSLSEFGFVEKRYGTHEKQILRQAGSTATLQGYWEYLGYPIYVVDGVFYYEDANGISTPITRIYREVNDADAPVSIQGENWRYPNVFSSQTVTERLSCSINAVASTPTEEQPYESLSDITTLNPLNCDSPGITNGYEYTVCGINDEGTAYDCQDYVAAIVTRTVTYYVPSFPQVDGVYRDMNAVNVNNVLYIFTGKYPLYAKIVTDAATGVTAPRLYQFSVSIPTYDELVVTGHNLLEDNYEQAYGFTTPNPHTGGGSTVQGTSSTGIFELDEAYWYPKIPFTRNEGSKGSVNIDFDLRIFGVPSFATNQNNAFYEFKVDRFRYRNSLPGATDNAFIEGNLSAVDFDIKSNYNGSVAIDFEKDALSETFFVNDLSESFARYLATLTDANTNTYFHRWDFLIHNRVDKNEFVKNDKYVINLLNDNNGAVSAAGLGQGTTIDTRSAEITIIPFSENNTELAGFRKTILNSDISKTVSGTFTFDVPLGLVDTNAVAYYKVLLEGTVIGEKSGSLAHEALFSDFETNYPSYFCTVVPIGQKTGTSSPNYIGTSSSFPFVGLSITDLLAGTWDFEITFAYESYNYSNSILKQGDKKTASIIIYNIPITPEKLDDFPGKTLDFLPKLKPIWTCNRVIEHYGKLMVWGSTEMPTAIFYSFPDRPTYFPAGFYLDFTNDTNQKIEAVTPFMNILVAQTASQTWGIRGNSGLIDAPAPYVPFGINGTVGTIAPKSVRPVRNHLFFLSRQGIIALKSLYAADEQYNIEFVDRRIRNIVPQDSNAVGIQYDNQYWLNFPKDSITLRWYIDKKAWVKDVYQGWHTTNNESDFGGVFKYQIRDGNLEFITHPSKILNGTNTYLYKMGVDENLPTDLFEPIKAKLETSFLNQNYPFHPKNYKEAKLDFTLQNEYNKGRVTILDSSSDSETAQIQYNTSTTDITISAPDATVRKNHRYRVDFYINPQTDENGVTTYDNVNVFTVSVEGTIVPDTQLTDAQGNTIPSYILEIPDNLVFSNPLNIVFNLSVNPTYTSDDYIVIRDVTYDDELTFDAYVISEDQTLNFVNTSGYDQETVDIGVDLTEKERLGDWVFGSSDFGKKVTAVKTIKLAGKGYNAKVYLEDVSRSKWTLESLGITYKMKRARSK